MIFPGVGMAPPLVAVNSFVFKQPENAEELAQCREAMEGCPVEAIGEDGEG